MPRLPFRKSQAMLVALALTSAIACDRPSTGEAPRVILIGLDGATPSLVDSLIAAGRLPTLASLKRDGVSGRVRSLQPLLSPRLWATIATGKKPAKHGIKHWVKGAPDGSLELYYSADRTAHALWNIASEAGMTVSVVNWLNTYPPEIVNGVMVSDHTFTDYVAFVKTLLASAPATATVDRQAQIHYRADNSPVYPVSWLERLAAVSPEARVLSGMPLPASVAAPLPSPAAGGLVADYTKADESVVHIAKAIDEATHPRLTMVLLQGVDRTSHHLYGCTAPPATYPSQFHPTESERANCIRVLEAYYELADALIGTLIASFSSTDLVVVVSDHGFEPVFGETTTGGHDTDAALDGVFFARGRDVPRGQPAGDIAITYVTPMILTWLGLPLAEDFDGVEPAFLETKRAGLIPTYDTRPIERLEWTRSGQEAQMIETLRSLGYVD